MVYASPESDVTVLWVFGLAADRHLAGPGPPGRAQRFRIRASSSFAWAASSVDGNWSSRN